MSLFIYIYIHIYLYLYVNTNIYVCMDVLIFHVSVCRIPYAVPLIMLHQTLHVHMRACVAMQSGLPPDIAILRANPGISYFSQLHMYIYIVMLSGATLTSHTLWNNIQGSHFFEQH